jgi:hypothetical protein
MNKRPRIDLDGLTLHATDGPSETVAVVRYRTVEGLVLGMPESVDILVPWSAIDRADLCLQTGDIAVNFSDAFVKKTNWLGGKNELAGRWIDRLTLRREDVLKAK